MKLQQAACPRRSHRVLAGALLAAALLALAACGQRGGTATQTAAKVDKGEITVHQINFILQQQRGLRPEQADAAGRQVLERLIDQELAVQKANSMDLDRDPRVMQALEAARREVMARAYAEKVGEGAAKPTAEEVGRYYAEKPELFSQRRIYSLQELSVQANPEQVQALRERMASFGTPNELVEYLRGSGLRFSVNQAVRAAEQLPLQLLSALARMKDGQATLITSPQGAQVLLLTGSRTEPVSEEQARPAIEQFLLNDRKRQLIDADRKAMRAAAKIEYFGAFAQGAPAAASAPAAAPLADTPATMAPAAPAVHDPAGAVGSDDVARGLGVKR
ncbi:MAG: EpsD family peptidyl-prolyl cis-trans isomerase [Burkholderiales bacterium]|nr:EpsD family peptidyl-prolyl cis-trans isomerase [Burkholderiales bacterium]